MAGMSFLTILNLHLMYVMLTSLQSILLDYMQLLNRDDFVVILWTREFVERCVRTTSGDSHSSSSDSPMATAMATVQPMATTECMTMTKVLKIEPWRVNEGYAVIQLWIVMRHWTAL